MIIDTSAIPAILLAEPDAGRYETAIASASPRRMSAVALLEAAMAVEGRGGSAAGLELDALLERAEIELMPVTRVQTDAARRAWRRFGKGNHPAALNFGGCFAYALAKTHRKPLLFRARTAPAPTSTQHDEGRRESHSVTHGIGTSAMDTAPAYPRIPYGEADFRRIRLRRWLYVDKTRFLRRMEDQRYAFLIRPRRFGKSLWASVLENYYDRFWADDFETTFAGTDIGRSPTDERSRYVTLRFDFSAVNDKLETLEREFEIHCHTELEGTLERHPDLFPEAALQRILAPPSITGKLGRLFRYSGDHDIPLYVMIDEYDNFANSVLAHHGAEAYHSFAHGGGFYRNFFATLKSGTARSGGGIDRLFITGVSPITMDDVTSGFNIGKNISLHPDFNEMVGFTEAEVRRLVDIYRGHGVLDQDADEAMALMGEWYNGYRFAKAADTDLFNTDMVLYYLDESMPNRGVPDSLIDTNVRIDYGKLRHLLVVGRQLNGNFDLLREIIGEGQKDVLRIQPSFPLKQLADEENFLSLLHYFGLLSIRGVVDGMPRLAIPNQTVKQLMYGYLRDAYRDVEVFRVGMFRFKQLMMRMANQGEWRPALEFLGEAIARQTGIRDYIAGEKVVQGFLAAYLSVTDFYVFRSEAELGKGHADISLEPLLARFPHLRVGYLIELKYLARSESADQAGVMAAVGDATAQLRRYLADERLVRQFPGVRFVGLAVVFHGWEMVFCDAVTSQSDASQRSTAGRVGPSVNPSRRRG